MKKLLPLFILTMALAAAAQDFQLRLSIKGAQVGELFLGCKTGATNDYDKGLDIFVPPPAMQNGHVGISTTKNDGLWLYKDIRTPAFPQTWQLNCTPAGKAGSISISWKQDQLPAQLSFTVKVGKGTAIDMRNVSTVRVKEQATVIIEAK